MLRKLCTFIFKCVSINFIRIIALITFLLKCFEIIDINREKMATTFSWNHLNKIVIYFNLLQTL